MTFPQFTPMAPVPAAPHKQWFTAGSATVRTTLALIIGLASGAVCGAETGGPWSERFPEIAARVPHLDARMACAEESVRLGVIKSLTYFHNRDSKRYPPFLRALLKDPSPKVRWEAIRRLHEHNVFLEKAELPSSFELPLAGVLEPGNAAWLRGFRDCARNADKGAPLAGWAICGLGIARDAPSVPLARALGDSPNVFVRFSAAMALLQLGEKEEAIEALKALAARGDDQSRFYELRAAEVLVRLGHKQYIETLIGVVEHRGGPGGYADSGEDILSDLTGRYYPTAAEWRAWWAKEREKLPYSF